MENFYNVRLDTTKLTKLEQNILNALTPSQRESILQKQILIKDKWVEEYLKSNPNLKREDVLNQWLTTLANQESVKLLNFFQKDAVLYSKSF